MSLNVADQASRGWESLRPQGARASRRWMISVKQVNTKSAVCFGEKRRDLTHFGSRKPRTASLGSAEQYPKAN